MKQTHMNDIDETLNLTQGQGHKVKGQGHIYIYVKFLFRLYEPVTKGRSSKMLVHFGQNRL